MISAMNNPEQQAAEQAQRPANVLSKRRSMAACLPSRSTFMCICVYLWAVLFIPVLHAEQLATQPATDADESAAFRAAAERVCPCVVTIETLGGTQPAATSGRGTAPAAPVDQQFIVADGPTTGLIWSADGLILASTFNFVRQPVSIFVVLADGRRFVAELLARDEIHRLAMLKIAADELPVPQWVSAPEATRVGQWAIALGRGFGSAGCSLNVGIISGLKRMGGMAIQTDAKLSPANFGGPLIDLQGRVLGLCVPLGMNDNPIAGIEWYNSGIGFAVPHEHAAPAAMELAEGHNLRRGYLGVSFDRRPEAALRILAVHDPSPAARAGLATGDIIEAFEDQPVSNYAQLSRILRGRAAGKWVTLRIRRGDRSFTRDVILAVPEDVGPAPVASAPDAANEP